MTSASAPRHTMYAEFTAQPGNEGRVADLVREFAALVRAEPGNVAFSPFHKREKPAEFFVYEEYVDAAAFREHLAADYGIRFNEALSELIVGDGSELTFLQPL